MPQELKTRSMEPNIVIERLFNKEQILEAIIDCNRKITDVKGEMAETKTAINDLHERKLHYKHLIDAGKYDKASMDKSLSGMDVEIRRYRDVIDKQIEVKAHYVDIITGLNVKLAEVEHGYIV